MQNWTKRSVKAMFPSKEASFSAKAIFSCRRVIAYTTFSYRKRVCRQNTTVSSSVEMRQNRDCLIVYRDYYVIYALLPREKSCKRICILTDANCMFFAIKNNQAPPLAFGNY